MLVINKKHVNLIVCILYNNAFLYIIMYYLLQPKYYSIAKIENK